MKKARVIAFYLPQYYPTPTNSKCFGEGFTEWTNVRKARPLFRGHYQPIIPADLGYYDLRSPETRERQAQLAKIAGIEGFCYYHYWFGGGRIELDLPLKEVIKLKSPDFPFCLCWANQSWYSKFWNKDAIASPRLIVEQKYEDEEGIRNHFLSLLDVFSDERYIRVEGKLLFMIYRPHEYSGVERFMAIWKNLAKEHLGTDFFFIGQATKDCLAAQYLSQGFDGVNILRKDDYLDHWRYNNYFMKYWNKAQRLFGSAPYHYEYKDVMRYFIDEDEIEQNDNIFPTLLPNWDHSPRSGKKAQIFTNATPEHFKRHLETAINCVENKPDSRKIIFLKSWNEWGEGNYVEPDTKFGHGYLDVLRECLNIE